MYKKDIANLVFGRLTVVHALPSVVDSNGIKRTVWECKCECGTITTARTANLLNGSHISCGCYRAEFGIPKFVHGDSATKLYGVWAAMKSRCSAKSGHSFIYYASRGISVCNGWSESFTAFKEWAVANGYREGLEIDRIDTDGNYCPENCRFVTHWENCQNRRPRHAALV